MTSKVYGDGLRRVLARASFSQTDLAQALGVTRQTVNAWVTRDMNRRKMPTEDMQRRIAEVLGMKPGEMEKVARARGRDIAPYERADAAAKTGRQNALRALARQLREHGPRYLDHMQRVIDFPGFGELHCDYADNNIVVLIEYRVRRVDRVYQCLWRLFQARVMAERVGVERRNVLALIDSGEASRYQVEAEAAGIEVLAFDTPEQLADWIVKQSS